MSGRSVSPRPDAAGRLRSAGLRCTPQRCVLLDALTPGGHHTAEALWEATGREGMALTTVYRTLDALEAAGLVERLHLPEGRWAFELTDGKQHAHGICRICGSISELDLPIPADRLAHRFTAERIIVTALGRCTQCTP